MNDINAYQSLILKDIFDETKNATAACLGGDPAYMLDAREMHIGGMIELAGLLGLSKDFIEVLDEHRWTLITAASNARRR